jgi:hypothetical protein
MSDLDVTRKSITATLDDIAETERRMGGHLREPDEWQQLKDIVARIERRLAAQRAA